MGASRSFAASTDRLTVTANSTINNIFVGGATVSAWIYPTDGSSPWRIFNKTGGTTVTPSSGWMFYITTTTGNTRIRLYQAFASNWRVWQSTSNITLNAWNHVAVSYDNGATSNNPTFYINGVNDGYVQIITTGTGSYASDASDTLYLGGNNNSDRGWRGQLNYMQMWDATKTIDEINESRFRPGSVRSNLVGYWPLFGLDSPERDLSGLGNTAAITGATESFNGAPVRLF